MSRTWAVVAASLLPCSLLTCCTGATPTTQLAITSLMTTCGTNSDDCPGRPAEGATVEVSGSDDEVAASGVLDEGGWLELDLDPGEYEVVVTLGGTSTEPAEVVLTTGQYVTLPMNLPAPTD